MAKLTDRQRKRIIAEYVQGGISQRKLAEKYKVSPSAIAKVLKNGDCVQKCAQQKEQNTKDMLSFLEERSKSAQELIDDILSSAATKIKDAPLRDQMGAIKILSAVFGKSCNGYKPDGVVTQIIIQPEDASGVNGDATDD